MRVLVCPQEFKGSLTAAEAARCIAAGVRLALPEAEVELMPLADGGPGTVAVLCAAAGGTLTPVETVGPLGAALQADFALLPRPGGAHLAVIEAAATAGLVLVRAHERDPARASTFGVGEQLRAALTTGAREVIVGVGGTGTNDGGAGAAQALGCRLLDARDTPIGRGPRELLRLTRIDSADVEPLLTDVRVRVAVDVRNRLLGEEGATQVYGPQKGVSPELAPDLERALNTWARIVERDLGIAIAEIDGGGAGGGLAAGLAAAAHATIEDGAALVGEAVGLVAAVARAGLVVTGEGCLDAQTAYGKTVSHVLQRALAAGKPCIAVAGSIEAVPAGMRDVEQAMLPGESIEIAMSRAAGRVQSAADRLLRRFVP